ncbi:MAG: Oxygen-independent coproporphyrinogen-III oxidase-like protein YqeR [Verrucomicrobia subdivision 3 bacterium]|nr:Oxygen-independent coproporphyrinogen-III oxidase-like protein YqeR [Limisphaerales bacterium]MCS1416330.1 Oxygen-independent coproporphyrinogen-III oxidase-like protein YqeR [Limisphaerales bacterium]
MSGKIDTTVEPPKNQAKDTTVGNYFVSNYPPFSFWQKEGVADFRAALERPPKPGTPLGLYLHIPFCRKRCHFCYFRVYTDKNAAAINGYIKAATQELELYRKYPFIGGRQVEFVYFGGGTPSYLSVDQLTQLTTEMKRTLPWDAVREVTFECEPGTLTQQKLKVIHEMGATRLSLGIENFDDHILEINGRAHRSREIERAYGYARELGFPQINIDLIAGMVEETEDNWKHCIKKTLELSPDSVTLYQMEVPYNTTIYKEMKAEGKLVAPVADWETKRRWVREAFESLEAADYEVGSAYTAVKDKSKTSFVYRDQLWAGADLLALGVASFGHINGTHYQNQHDFGPYVNDLLDGNLPVYRALTPGSDERLIREFILQLKLGVVSCQYFNEKFETDVLERFAEPLQQLKNWGFLSVDGDQIQLNRDGLIQVDRLLQEFFLPEHRNVRYA